MGLDMNLVPDSANMAIVGGGIVGCSIAYHRTLRGETEQPRAVLRVQGSRLRQFGKIEHVGVEERTEVEGAGDVVPDLPT